MTPESPLFTAFASQVAISTARQCWYWQNELDTHRLASLLAITDDHYSLSLSHTHTHTNSSLTPTPLRSRNPLCQFPIALIPLHFPLLTSLVW